MKRLPIQHLTEYFFPTQVTLNQHRLLLRPREGHDVRIESSELQITPTYNIKWQRDVFDYYLSYRKFYRTLEQKLVIASEVVIQHYEQAPFNFLLEDYAVIYPFTYGQSEQVDLAAFFLLILFFYQHIINNGLQQIGLNGMETFSLLVKLNQAINRQFLFMFNVREEAGVQFLPKQ